jgi:hypothetical protein
MMLSRWKVIAAVVLALTLVGGGGGLLFRLDGSSDNLLAVPVDPPPLDGKPDPRVVPGAVAISKPDKLGLVTMLRPMVSRLSVRLWAAAGRGRPAAAGARPPRLIDSTLLFHGGGARPGQSS